MELTKEHFDQVVSKLATKEQVESVAEQIEGLARMTSRGFEDVLERMDVRDRVDKLEIQMKELRGALHLSS